MFHSLHEATFGEENSFHDAELSSNPEGSLKSVQQLDKYDFKTNEAAGFNGEDRSRLEQ